MENVRNFKAELMEVYRIALRHYDGDIFKARAAVNAWLKGLLGWEVNKAKRAGKGTA